MLGPRGPAARNLGSNMYTISHPHLSAPVRERTSSRPKKPRANVDREGSGLPREAFGATASGDLEASS